MRDEQIHSPVAVLVDAVAGDLTGVGPHVGRQVGVGGPDARVEDGPHVGVERLLGHRFSALRVRYWHDGEKSAWILDEIGKELPITIGVAVENGSIRNVRVLEFRESRGWEVRYPFFTDQFVDARLGPDEKLDRRIDGITGATLSVGAVTRIARVALVLHEHVSG